MGAATPTVLIDNERVRVTEWRFRPGEATGWHRHEYDYVVVPVTTGKLHLKEPDGERTVESSTARPTTGVKALSTTLSTRVTPTTWSLSKSR